MSHLRDAASWYWPGGTWRYTIFSSRGTRPSEVEASPVKAAALSTTLWLVAFSASPKKDDGEDEDKPSTASTRVRAENE